MTDLQQLRHDAQLIYQRLYYRLHKDEIQSRRYFREMEKAEENKVQQPTPPPPKQSKKKPPKRMTIETSSTPFILAFD